MHVWCQSNNVPHSGIMSCPLTKLDGGVKKLHTADDESVDWASSYGTWSAYANDNNKYLRHVQLLDITVALTNSRVQRRPPWQIVDSNKLYRRLEAHACPQQVVNDLTTTTAFPSNYIAVNYQQPKSIISNKKITAENLLDNWFVQSCT